MLDEHGIHPKKSMGQNFLHDPNAITHIADNADLPLDATVLEIGPGTGLLTRELALRAARVVAVEADDRFRPVLAQELAGLTNVEVIWGDFLDVDLTLLVGVQPYYVVANLPYYITSAILRKLLDHPNRPQRLVLTVQREVAERIMAEPGDMSILSVSVQFYGKPTLVTRLNPAAFWPRPDVESAVLRIDVFDQLVAPVNDTRHFFEVVRAGFSQKRKQLKNALSGGLGVKKAVAKQLLERAAIDPRRRAETLSVTEWGTLTIAYEDMLKDAPPH